MKITIQAKGLSSKKVPALCLPLFEDDVSNKSFSSLLKKEEKDFIRKILQQKDFSGKSTESLLTYPQINHSAKRLVLFGLGSEKDFTWEKFRQAIGRILSCLKSLEISSFNLILPGENSWDEFDLKSAVREAAQIYIMAGYRFSKYKTSKKDSKSLPMHLSYATRSDNKTLLKEIHQGMIIGEAVNFARDLVNHPSSYLTPTRMAALAAGSNKKLKCRILSEKEIRRFGMGGLLSVARGSKEPAKFIILEYLPEKKGKKPLVFVGKGVTFDTGGISIKQSPGMEQMKYDMAGAASVIGALHAISRLGIKKNVVGLIPAAENMPSGEAYKPGDILKMMSGKTVEVLNTDAEGRLLLADALTYALRYRPEAIIDLATLTGACIVALGDSAIGMMGNNSKVLTAVKAAGEKTSERVWELPLWEEYRGLLKSDIADLKNVGGKKAMTINGGMFLQEFVDNTPWVHLDIAGTAWTEKDKPYHPKGATAAGVRLLVDLASNWK